MEAKLKSLKVVDLKALLTKANVSPPAKANKSDLISRILGSPAAIDVYNAQYPSESASTVNDDLVRQIPLFSLHFSHPLLDSLLHQKSMCLRICPILWPLIVFSLDWNADEVSPSKVEESEKASPVVEPVRVSKTMIYLQSDLHK